MVETEIYGDAYFMKKAVDEGRKAFEEDEIPIGAVVVLGNKIIGKGYNQTEKLTDVTAHAEMLAITAASAYLGSKYLEECTLYVTVEPCTMCASAIRWARLGRVVYGAFEPKFGYTRIAENLIGKTTVVQGICEAECAALMTSFFQGRRKKT